MPYVFFLIDPKTGKQKSLNLMKKDTKTKNSNIHKIKAHDYSDEH